MFVHPINLPAYKNHPTTGHKQPIRFLKTHIIDFPKNLITPQYISTRAMLNFSRKVSKLVLEYHIRLLTPINQPSYKIVRHYITPEPTTLTINPTPETNQNIGKGTN